MLSMIFPYQIDKINNKTGKNIYFTSLTLTVSGSIIHKIKPLITRAYMENQTEASEIPEESHKDIHRLSMNGKTTQ